MKGALTKKKVFWLFIVVVWVYSVFALLDVLNIIELRGLIFYILTSAPPLFMFLYTKAEPPEPNFMTIIKVGGTSLVVLSILAGIHAYLE